MRAVLLFTCLIALPGCALLEQLGRADTSADSSVPPPVMMMADSVPLVTAGKHAQGQPMPVPVEPSPFMPGKGAKPAAMKSDNERHRSPAGKSESGPQPIPAEPVPSAQPDS